MIVQNTNLIMMVEPSCFRRNESTAESNAFQKELKLDRPANELALAEFDAFVKQLKEAGVQVLRRGNREGVDTPDAVFPNNWISTHPDGKAVLYPMESLNRRLERQPDIIDFLIEDQKLMVNEVLDLSVNEKFETYLEGTGSIVFDHQAGIAYACTSSRTDEELLERLCNYIEYEPFVFKSVDEAGKSIYHTNVMMAIGAKWAVVCLDSVELGKRAELEKCLSDEGKDIIAITYEQMNHFCGNIIELRDSENNAVVVMSTNAWEHFSEEQQKYFENNGKVVKADLSTIETLGGGGARCMIAEIFLPEQALFRRPD